MDMESVQIRPIRVIRVLRATHRVGEYRAILYIENERLLILVIEAGHRKKIYRKH